MTSPGTPVGLMSAIRRMLNGRPGGNATASSALANAAIFGRQYSGPFHVPPAEPVELAAEELPWELREDEAQDERDSSRT